MENQNEKTSNGWIDKIMQNKKKALWIGIGVVVLLCLLMPTCGGGDEGAATEEAPVVEEKPHIVKAAQTEVKGDLKGCYELVEKDYKVKKDKSGLEKDIIIVELKRTSKPLPYKRTDVVIFPEASDSNATYCAGFGIEVLDANGDVIAKDAPNSTPYSWDEMTAALQLVEGDTTTIQFNFYDSIKEAASIRVTSIVMKNEERKSAKEAAKASKKASSDDDDDEMSTTEKLKEKAKKVVNEVVDDDDLEDLETAAKVAKESAKLVGGMLDLLL